MDFVKDVIQEAKEVEAAIIDRINGDIIRTFTEKVFSTPVYVMKTKCEDFVVGEEKRKRREDMSNDIVDVNVIVPDKVVEITFADGDKQKSVCHKDDHFSLEIAISICLAKHLIGGSSRYNKTIAQGIKVYDNKIANKIAAEEEKKRIAKKKAKKEVYLKRRAEERKEEKIEIQKEAYVRALREVGGK